MDNVDMGYVHGEMDISLNIKAEPLSIKEEIPGIPEIEKDEPFRIKEEVVWIPEAEIMNEAKEEPQPQCSIKREESGLRSTMATGGGRKLSSFVHSMFTYDKDSDISSCNYCNSKLKGKITTNLSKHAQTSHGDKYVKAKEQDSKKPEPSSFKVKKINYEKEKAKILLNAEEYRDACVEMVTVNGRPFSILEDSGFRKITDPMLQALHIPRVTMDNISYYIAKKANEIRKEISMHLKQKLISLKVDAATMLDRAFLGINIQYMYGSKRILRTLAVIELVESHTGEYLKKVISEVLLGCGLDQKNIFSVTTDNGANMVKAVKLLDNNGESDEDNEEVNEKSTDSESHLNLLNEIGDIQYSPNIKVHHIRCIAHTLQLAVLDSLKSSERIILKIRGLVKELRHTTYLYIVKKEGKNKPILDCSTRWNSTFDMVSRLLDLKDFVEDLSKNDEKIKQVTLGKQDWETTQNLAKCLLPPKILTIQLQSENLTIGDFIGHWENCKFKLQQIDLKLADSIFKEMNRREDCFRNNELILASIFMDPRYKFLLKQSEVSTTITYLANLYQRLVQMGEGGLLESSSGESSGDDFDDYLTSQNPFRHSSSTATKDQSTVGCSKKKIMNLLNNYYTNQKKIKHNTNVTEYWLESRIEQPELFKVAMILLGVPATQVSIERLLSGIQFIFSDLRHRLGSQILQDQLIVRLNTNWSTGKGHTDCSSLQKRRPVTDNAEENRKAEKQMKL